MNEFEIFEFLLFLLIMFLEENIFVYYIIVCRLLGVIEGVMKDNNFFLFIM